MMGSPLRLSVPKSQVRVPGRLPLVTESNGRWKHRETFQSGFADEASVGTARIEEDIHADAFDSCVSSSARLGA